MANNGNGGDPLGRVLAAIESVREELIGLRADLAGSSAVTSPSVENLGAPPSVIMSAPAEAVVKKERKNPWASLTPNQRAEKVSAMSLGRTMRKEAPTPWRLFTDRIRDLLKSAGYSGADLGVKMVQFASSLKDEKADFSAWTDEEILARRKTWAPPNVAKVVKTASPLPASPAPSLAVPGGFQALMLDGNRYLVNLATGYAYDRLANGSKGEWAGIFTKSPKPGIDTSVPEPANLDFAGGRGKSTRKHKRRHGKTRKH